MFLVLRMHYALRLSLSFKGFQEALEELGVHFVILSTSGEGDGTHFSQLPNVEDSTSGFRKCEFPEVSWCFKVVLKLLNLKADFQEMIILYI